jgi:hypothetical protein
MNTKRILSSIGVGAGAIILGLGIQYAAAAWTAAPSSPPNGNVAAPINVSGGGESGTTVYSQIKTGLLTLENLTAVNLNVASGTIAAGNVLTSDANGNASWEGATGGGGSVSSIPNNIVVFNYASANPTTNVVNKGSGSYTWTAPTNVTKVLVQVWGGGGGGTNFDCSVDNQCGSGGGGGGYAESIISVTPGTSYNITVGAGSAGIGTGFPNPTSNGQSSSFGSLVSATGGTSAGSGGMGVGQIVINGAAGTGFSGGSSPNGGDGNGGASVPSGISYVGSVQSGTVPGGGVYGGVGGNGRVIIEY